MSGQGGRYRGLASLALLAVLAAGCASSVPASATPFITTNPGSVEPIASIPMPPAAATPSPTTAPSVAGSTPPLPDGDYFSVETYAMAAAILSNPKIANDDSKGFLAGFGATAAWTIRLATGQWTLYGQDGAAGDEGTYAFIGDHTMVLLDNSKVPQYVGLRPARPDPELDRAQRVVRCGAPRDLEGDLPDSAVDPETLT